MNKTAVNTGENTPGSQAAQKRKKDKWGLRAPWLFLPIASLVSLVFGVNASLVLAAISPLERGISIGIAVLIGPLIAGAAINQLIGAKRQWRSCGHAFLLSLLLAVAAWSLNTLLCS